VPNPVGPEGREAGLEPVEATVDAVELVGVLVAEDPLEWTGEGEGAVWVMVWADEAVD